MTIFGIRFGQQMTLQTLEPIEVPEDETKVVVEECPQPEPRSIIAITGVGQHVAKLDTI